MSNLKPCPFCGNDSPTLIYRHGKDGWTENGGKDDRS